VNAFIDRLVTEVTAGFKGDVASCRGSSCASSSRNGSCEEHADYDPMKEYGFKMPGPPTLRAEEQHALTGAALTAPDVDGDESRPTGRCVVKHR